MMSDQTDARTDPFFVSRVAHVVERTGLAMSGAMCGTFVAAYLTRAGIDPFDSIGFIVSMILIGMIGFYLGIDIPGLRASHMRPGARPPIPRWDSVELLSATGTFLAAMAALTSVYAIVFDEAPQGVWEFAIGCWWFIGIAMQIGAGAIGRLRLVSVTRLGETMTRDPTRRTFRRHPESLTQMQPTE
jgi:hypothetical protein